MKRVAAAAPIGKGAVARRRRSGPHALPIIPAGQGHYRVVWGWPSRQLRCGGLPLDSEFGYLGCST